MKLRLSDMLELGVKGIHDALICSRNGEKWIAKEYLIGSINLMRCLRKEYPEAKETYDLLKSMYWRVSEDYHKS